MKYATQSQRDAAGWRDIARIVDRGENVSGDDSLGLCDLAKGCRFDEDGKEHRVGEALDLEQLDLFCSPGRFFMFWWSFEAEGQAERCLAACFVAAMTEDEGARAVH